MISLERHPRYCRGTAGSYAKARDRADGLWAGGGRAAHAPFWPNRLVHQLLAALPTSRVIGAVPEFSDFVGHFRNSIETSAGSPKQTPNPPLLPGHSPNAGSRRFGLRSCRAVFQLSWQQCCYESLREGRFSRRAQRTDFSWSYPTEQYPYLRPSRSDVRARTILARFTTRNDPCASTHRTRRNRQIVLQTKGELSVQVLSQSFQ